MKKIQPLTLGLLMALGTLVISIGMFVFMLTLNRHSHEFVSEDGGFVMKSGFKTPVRQVEKSFVKYKFLRECPTMVLHRTTRLKGCQFLSRAAKYRHVPDARKTPVDWHTELEGKCLQEYIPALPVVMEAEGVRLFFFNQYDDIAVEIHGLFEGRLFGLTLKNNLRNSADGKAWDSPVWSYTKGINTQEDRWRDVWSLVNRNRQKLIAAWEKDRKTLAKKFERAYDQLF